MKVADPVVKACPSCGSEKTAFQARTGLASFIRLIAPANPLHKYRCLKCGHSFHAADRRRFKRASQLSAPR